MAERKKFIDVEIPMLKDTIQVLGTIKDLVGKTIKLDLSRKMRGKGLLVVFEIFNHEDKLVGVPKNMELMTSYTRKVVRKGTDGVDDSFLTHCLDVPATMKPFLVTRKKVSRAVRRNLRNTAREYLMQYTKEKSYIELCNEILDGSLQRGLLPKLKKVYPLAFCDIRVFGTKELAKLDIASAVTVVEGKDVQAIGAEEEVVSQDEEIAQADEADTPEAEETAEKEVEKEVVAEVVEEIKEEVEAEEDKTESEEVVEEEKNAK
ncbi:MAG: ribosomal protein S3AE [Patescibacteria group bacterium]|jgi:ribosomal protein S3AE